MICPKCKGEYREGYTMCVDCGCELTDSLPVENDTPERDIIPAFLCEAADDFEAELIMAKLRADGIFAYKKYKGSDSYNVILLGRAILGVEIYVAEEDLSEAKESIK